MKDKIYKLTLFCIPFSFDISFAGDFSLDIPVEPMLVAWGLYAIWRIVFVDKGLFGEIFPPPTHSSGEQSSIVLRPLTLAVLVWWLITGILVLTSSMFIISLKRWIMLSLQLCFAYFLALDFIRNEKRIREYFLWLGVGTAGVMLISWIRHASWGFGAAYAPAMARPFFDDHTVFGATIVFGIMLFPALVKWENGKGIEKLSKGKNKWWTLAISGLFLGLFLTYSRGAWLSLILAGFLGWGIWRKWPWRIGLGIATMAVLVFFLLKGPASKIVNERRPQSLSAGWTEHVMSSFNFVQHASNLERVNRWKCAWRMFKSKPLTGWGPGTYSFQYGPFQREDEMTRISTLKGDKGNAHSEYLGHLAEGGILWGIGFLSLWIVSFWAGIRFIRRNKDPIKHLMVSALLTALISYLIHGFVNSFLDQIEIATWVFGAWAVLVKMEDF